MSPLALAAFGLGAALAAGPAAAAEPSPTPTAQEVLACARDNLPERSSIQTVRLDSVDRLGSESRSRLTVYWERPAEGKGRSLVRVLEPPDVRGTKLLILERDPEPDLWSYVPELGRARRIHKRSLQGSFLGSQFTYEDIERLQGLSGDGEARRLPDARVGDRPVWVVEARPAPDSASGYGRIVTYVDQETCVQLRSVFYDPRDRPVKEMLVPWDEVRQEASGWMGRRMEMRSLEDATRSTLEVEELEVDVDIPRKYFSQGALEGGRP